MKGPPPPGSFWAKLERRRDSQEILGWHPLVDHCADVAACCEALLGQAVIRRRLARLGGLPDLSQVQVQRLAALAALHDAGKFNVGFQNKARPQASFACGHVAPIVGLFGPTVLTDEVDALARALAFPELAQWCADEDVFGHLLLAALAHHGRPVRPEQPVDRRCWQATGGLDPFAGIADLTTRIRTWLPEAFAPSGEPLPSAPAFQHAVSGLVTLADWLGSDTDFFPYSDDLYSDDLSKDRFPRAREAAHRALVRVGLDTGGARTAVVSGGRSFEQVFGFRPRPMQQQVAELPCPDASSLVILESETGSGKTEAALARFLALFWSGLVDGLYFALPTRTAATQMHRRVVEAVERAFPSGASPPVVLAVPGYLVVDRFEGTREHGFQVAWRGGLPDPQSLWPDDERERLRHRGWAAENPKRYLAGAVAVGTIDQVLLSTLTVPHAHLRATSLLRHLLVVDEVHASDAYMTRLLEEVLGRHLQAGGHALLMSATLGAAARTRLVSPGAPAGLAPLEDAIHAPYPAITFRAGQSPPSLGPVRGSGESRTVRVDLVSAADEPERVSARALEAGRAGARVLVVRNTVRDCIATQEASERLAGQDAHGLLLACRSVAAPHHARFASLDRVALDQAIESQFGKNRPEGGCVAVATQTVQQSLDLDADLILTDLCPMDVLLQRLGRLHRHTGRARPPGFRYPRAEVLVPGERDLGRFLRVQGDAIGPHGYGTVYENLLVLETTWRLLERHAEIVSPSMNREVVERSTHPGALEALAAELGERWQAHWTRAIGKGYAHRVVASTNLLRWTEPFGESGFPDDLERAVRTRLGAGDRIARFAEPQRSPFEESVQEIIVPAHLAGGAPDDAQTVVDVSQGGQLIFWFGPRRFLYDRLGLRPAARPEPDEDLTDA